MQFNLLIKAMNEFKDVKTFYDLILKKEQNIFWY